MKRRTTPPATATRFRQHPAFTLSELVVAVAILALMMLLAGQVFTITVKSTGQATALATVNQRLRALEQSLREDLRYVSPQNSILVAMGRSVNAYWSAQGRDSDAPGAQGKKDPYDGYPHLADPEREDASGNLVSPRADVLAFFTSRWGTSATYPGASSNSQFVVYGHVNPCEYALDASKKKGYRQDRWDPEKDGFPVANPSAGQRGVAETVARDWHLSRRALLLMPGNQAPPKDVSYRDPIDGDYSVRWRKWDEGSNLKLVDPIDAMENDPDDPDNYALLNGFADILYNFDYDGVVLRETIPWPLTDPDSGLDGPQYDGPRETWDHLFDWLVKPSQGRTTLDGSLPAALAEQGGLAGYLLSHCCSFKVEWTFDDRSLMAPYGYPDGVLATGDHVVWFDTLIEKDVNLLKTLEDEAKYYDDKKDRQRRQAFMEMHDVLVNTDTQMAPCRFDPIGVYGPDAPSAMGMFWFPRTVSGTCRTPDWDDPALGVGPDPFFPTALRITVDVMDDLGRLDRPVRHVMVIPVGQ